MKRGENSLAMRSSCRASFPAMRSLGRGIVIDVSFGVCKIRPSLNDQATTGRNHAPMGIEAEPIRRARSRRETIHGMVCGLVLCGLLGLPHASWAQSDGANRRQVIPVLAVTTGAAADGVVLYVRLSVAIRSDRAGLDLHFAEAPGRFSSMTQRAVQQAIKRAALSLGLATDSWTVTLSVPYAGVTVDGDSLSAMVGLSVAALVQGERIPDDVVMTGTITPEGLIAPVGAVPLKLAAAATAGLRRVLVSSEQISSDAPSRLSSVRSVQEAYVLLMAGRENS